MSEISWELLRRNVSVCTNCGAIYDETSSTDEPCPNCEGKSLMWITPTHTWIDELKMQGES